MGRGDARQEARTTSQNQLGFNQQALDQVQDVNQVDQVTPWGSQMWQPDGSLQTSLNPDDQQLLDGQRQVKQQLLAALMAGSGGQGQGPMAMGGGSGKQGANQQPPPMAGGDTPPMM